ncbi:MULTISPECIES: hypothetical protein [unclassified Enterococcus]|uniref:hypothetical protein n=1 Tax=unclassified Enterococcus TaxID=2608891 RepID=UPI0015556671|nr:MULTISPECIES: hypothetical protein [unclassified Enterococcus]MBS7576418.1 hypothetical protein [Enterococcus sp. MMGLQ5-2]MBS7583650.1 hypothetical protein [Enterococcus sp. MMGLQ5-1]NPD11511.1 hypothetical protein [Enterococcus sp. MMGLQ5-1]NPD36255.1 hypothetical protein [Enterococcus sp. MMGLQ5-2]
MSKTGVKSGYHDETMKIASLTSKVAGVKDGWTRHDNLNTTQAGRVSKIYADFSSLVALYGSLAQKDVKEFNQLGVNIEVQDEEAAK